ncbi:sulfite oxidase [Alkalihalobacterium chitinilyticum]|uniref:Sulfite oxidase n=1 Tax=Alkalihalobacterium chitinilyticum TaxID=2980103 RepID=A0ABT5VG31_9BACI|nr:sulfite oxidase [Alkalihalobacterium chitinilyticum]MDE5413398.1 sulfite oxidase [Alkalihalobacterium chitinilyticum]
MSDGRVRPYFTTRGLIPENQETPIHFLRGSIFDKGYWFLRNHFQYPDLTINSGNLLITGAVKKAFIIKLEQLKTLPSKTITVPLICAGNQRAEFRPKVYGEQWEEGAVSQGVWTGVPLKDLLGVSGLEENALEVVFTGADRGTTPNVDEAVLYERSLPMNKALHPDTMVAYEYNGQPIPFKHGYPLRLIVPNWYGMASVKWLQKITVVAQPYEGPFQTDDYVYYPDPHTDEGKSPVTTIRVNSIIQQPLDHSIIDEGAHVIVGLAWSGEGQIEEVEISFDKGNTWEAVTLAQDQTKRYAWTEWQYNWTTPGKGTFTIQTRAKDSDGNVQPEREYWNRKGYGYNAIYRINVKVE